MASALLAFVHHVAAFALIGALAAELVLLSTPQDKRLRAVDALYGASAGLLLVAGLLRVVYFEKGASYYFSNTFFLAKLALFVLVGLLSIYPTVLFRRPALTALQQARVKTFLLLQLAGVGLILLCAALMAKGLG